MKSKGRFAKISGPLSLTACALAAVAVIGLGSPAHATDYSEGAPSGNPPSEPHDLSNTGFQDPNVPGSGPTYIGALTLGDNFISGATIPYGTAGPMGYDNQDNDFASFTVPTGDVLSGLFLEPGSSIEQGDQFFVAIAKGDSINITPPYTSSAGLLGYTLVSPDMIGTAGDGILSALGASNPSGFPLSNFPGATTFSAPLPSGEYTLWLLDGDHQVNYNLDLEVSAAPEPATWLMLLLGVGVIGAVLRAPRTRRRQAVNGGAVA